MPLMRYRLRTLLIVLSIATVSAFTVATARYAKSLSEATADYCFDLAHRIVYRDSSGPPADGLAGFADSKGISD